MGFSRQVLEWGAIAFSDAGDIASLKENPSVVPHCASHKRDLQLCPRQNDLLLPKRLNGVLASLAVPTTWDSCFSPPSPG